MSYLLLLAVLALGGFYFFKRKNKNKTFKKDYHFGLPSAIQAGKALQAKKYDEVNQILASAELNDRSQIVDHLALSSDEKELQAWMEASNNDESKLILGTYYLHQAWVARSHAYAENVSEANANRFFELLQQSQFMFERMDDSETYEAEQWSRRIRLNMSQEEPEFARDLFESVSQKYPTLVWPYIHYAELIQPKWVGSVEEVEAFYAQLPSDFLIHSIIELKLLVDGLQMGENYFSKQNEDLMALAGQRLVEIDAAINSQRLDSVHKYILFGYMERLSDSVGNPALREKYLKRIQTNFALYPYGLMV